MSLHEATRDLHHACEQHPVGARMFRAEISRQEWADWLWAFRCLHTVVDARLMPHMARDTLLAADLSVLPRPATSVAATRFAATLAEADEIVGAAYVLHGAHRSGGRVMGPTLTKRGLPCAHIAYADPDEVQTWVQWARGRADVAPQARATFGCLLAVMDEINGRAGKMDGCKHEA
jgi:heme oxygenase